MDEASDRDWGQKITIIYKFPPKYLKLYKHSKKY